MDLDQLQDKIGGISSYQVLIIGVVSLLPLGTSLMSQTSVFFSAVPDHRCAVPPLDDPNLYPNLSEENITDLLIPPDDSCNRYAYNLTVCADGNDLSCITEPEEVGTIQCDNGFYYDTTYYDETTVSEWDLLCGKQTLDSVANSLYFLGVFLGSAAVGPMMDWLSRKVSMLIMCILLVMSGIACTFSPSYEVYIILRIFVAASGIPCFISYYTYVSEMSDNKWRTFVAAWAQNVSAISHVILVGIAYFLRDWRELCLACSLIPSVYFLIFFFIPQSPRWLMSSGRLEEARKVIERFAESKGTSVTEEDWNLVVSSETEKKEAASDKKKYHVGDLFRPSLMRVVCCVIMFQWFTVSLLFYGLTLNVGTLAGDPYVNAALNATAEIVGYSLYYGIALYFGLRITAISSYFLAGICCLSTMLLAEFADGNEAMIEASRWVAIVGKVWATVSFSLVYQFTSELYPTVARGTAMSLGSMSARVGSMIMPFTLQLQQQVPWLTQTIFGIFALLSATFSFLLPETHENDLMTTIDEAEDFYRENMELSARILGKKKLLKSKEGADNKAMENHEENRVTVL